MTKTKQRNKTGVASSTCLNQAEYKHVIDERHADVKKTEDSSKAHQINGTLAKRKSSMPTLAASNRLEALAKPSGMKVSLQLQQQSAERKPL